jgi:hypothetical protein
MIEADLLKTPHGRELARQLGITLGAPDRPANQTLDASIKLDQHLTESIQALTPKESPRPMRGLQRLSNLTGSIVAQMDKEADEVADRLQAAKTRHDAALGKFKDFTVAVEQAATEAEAAIGQLSNLPPPGA